MSHHTSTLLRELLAAARHVGRAVGLDKSDLLATPGGLRWFPWVGTRGLRTLSILAELNGVTCETDRLSIWLPLRDTQFHEFTQKLLNAGFDAPKLGSRVIPRVVEKFDEYVPDDLLTRACAADRLAVSEALATIKVAH